MKRPTTPKRFDHTPESYYEHNSYFNEAEKIFDEMEKWFDKRPTIPQKSTFMDKCGLPYRLKAWYKILVDDIL